MEWISVKERLPEEGSEVIVQLGFINKVVIATLWNDLEFSSHQEYHWSYTNVGGSSHLESQDVTHWMPLPKPPKE